MKTPEEWADELTANQIYIIKEIQKDAYNEAILDAIVKARAKYKIESDQIIAFVDDDSIKKLLKK